MNFYYEMGYAFDEDYERLSNDLWGQRGEVALVVRGEDGVSTKTVAVFHNAAVRMESASTHYGGQAHVTTGKTVMQVRITTDDSATIYSEDYFSKKGKN